MYKINLSTGAATLLGNPNVTVKSLAVRTQIPSAITINAAGTQWARFRTDSPGVRTTGTLSGVAGGEVIVGIDFRPATGQLYGLGINASQNTGTLYIIDPNTGGTTVVGNTGAIAFTNSSGQPVDFPAANAGYGFDFNPMVDRIRVVTGTSLNFRINPVTGSPVDGDVSAIGTNPDGALNGNPSSATAAAYTNSYAGATATTLYVLESGTNTLRIQNPPNNGTLSAGTTITLGGSTLNFTTATGFDILAESGAQLDSNQVATGTGLAALEANGTNGLYRINLVTGAATFLGIIGNGESIGGLAVAKEKGNGFLPLNWASTAGTVYRIETSTDLVNWQPLPGTVTALASSSTVPVPRYFGESRRFWRAVAP